MSNQPIYQQPQHVSFFPAEQNQQYQVPIVQQPPVIVQQAQQPQDEKHEYICIFFFLGFLFSPIWIFQIIMYAFNPQLHLKIWGIRALNCFLFYSLTTFIVLFSVFYSEYEKCITRYYNY